MKTIFTLFIPLVLSACNDHMNQLQNYQEEYQKYEPAITDIMSETDNVISDSINAILDQYLEETMVYSCTWCVAEGKVFEPVAAISKKYPQTLTFVLNRALKGTNLTWGFRVLFKEFYPQQYQRLLHEADIQLIPEDEIQSEEERWQNKLEEYSLPFSMLVEEYLEMVQ